MLQIGYCDEARQFSVDSLDKYENAMKEMQAEADEAAEGVDEDEEEVPVKKTKIAGTSEVSVGLSKSKVSLTLAGKVTNKLATYISLK
jgi:flagellar hook-basal body complex protein FliE